MSYFLVALCIPFFMFLYKRYIPVYGVPCTELTKDCLIVDLRDYSFSARNPISGAITIPIAYLNRYNTEISSPKIHVVASNQLEKNLGIRLLRKKGFEVTGYTIIDDSYNIAS